MKEIDKIRYRVHTVNDDHHLYELPLGLCLSLC